ncbi:MAG TPA: CusA/CzcA family heavy metal efflux RND transporter [Myxococcales bacterium]|nr:CusA/CzcA family heavy metal efflux RND transporter [Myxococcales bacterium]
MQRIVALALKAPVIVAVLSLALVALGLWSYSRLDIEAYPNPVAPMIEVITQPNGMSAEEVERYVTIPLEAGLAGMIDLDHIRSQSLFGLSDVKCYFTWTPSYAVAQQRVINRLQFISLPQGIAPQLSPANPVGEIFRYVVRGPGYSLRDIKTAQDWILEKQFKQVPGVVDVVSYGGETLQFHVDVDPYRLKGHDVSLAQLTSAIANANQNVGGQRLTLGDQSYDVRGIGLIRNLADVDDIVVNAKNGTPVRVRDVAVVREGAAPRLGLVGKDQEPDVVQGIVLMRYGGNAIETLKGVHERVEHIRKYNVLPPGMTIEPYYDRLHLTQLTTRTVLENLVIGMLLVAVVLWLFLGSTRAALVTAVNIPLALLCAFSGMVATGTPANLISLGAVDFGIIVESTVIMVENIYRHLGHLGRGTVAERVVAAASEIASPMGFSTLIIVVAFIPLFTMTGVSGVIFSPLAHTYAFAIGGATLLAVTLTPVIAARLLHEDAAEGGGASEDEHDNFFLRTLRRIYAPVFDFAIRRPRAAVAVGLAPVVLAAALLPFIGGEFMPKLEEGNFWIRATLPMSISLEQSASYVNRMRDIVRSRPEITTVVSQLGRPDDGTDVSGFYNIEFFAPLKDRSQWGRGVTKEKLTEQLSQQLRDAFPGVVFGFSQAISDNVEEAMSGVKGENTVKVVGPDLRVNEEKARQIVEVLSQVRGIDDLGMFESLGQPDVRIVPDRARCARYGLNVGDVEAVVQAAIGGQAVTQVYQGEKHFDLVVRWAEPYRKDIQSIRRILVSTPAGGVVPLSQIADIDAVVGPAIVYREDASRYAPVKFSVKGRDLASTIGEAQARIDDQVKLPYDTHLEWGGEINQLHEATGRLLFIVPITLLVIAFFVYSSVKSWRDMIIVLLGIPAACSGGILALLITRTNLSISAAMGFVSIFGVAVQDALLVVTYTQRLWKSGEYRIESGARTAAERGLRPVLMTASVAMIGLFPAAISTGIGSETQKPLAIVVIGGAMLLAIVPRLLQPALLVLAHRRDPRYEEAWHKLPAPSL